MQIFRILLMAVILSLLPVLAGAADRPEHQPSVAGGHSEAGEKEGMPLHAVNVFSIGGFPVTNSMIATWIVALSIIIFAQVATRNVQAVPSGAQNFWEWLVEGLYNFLDGIVGHELVGKTFWFFATIFILILFANWFGLIPGVGTIGWGHNGPEGFHVDQPWLRGVNADLNMTFAMAMTFFCLLAGLGLSNEWRGGGSVPSFRRKRRNQRRNEGADGCSVSGGGSVGSGFDSFPSGVIELSVVWKYLRWRKHAGSDGKNPPRLVRFDYYPDPVLLYGASRGDSAGAGVYAVDGGFYAAHLPA